MKIKNFLQKYRLEIVLFAFASLLQGVVFLLTILYGSFLDINDSEAYLLITKNLIKYHGFFYDIMQGPQSSDTPLYFLFTGLLYWLVPKVWFLIFVQNIIAAFNVLIVFYLGKLFFNKKAAFLASALFAVGSQRLYFANQIMTETMFVFFFLLALYFFVKFEFHLTDKKFLFLSALFLGLAALTRPIAQYFILFLVFFLLARGFWRKKIKKYILFALMACIVFGAVIAPWLIRNKIHFNHAKLSSLGEYNLYFRYAIYLLEDKHRGKIAEEDLYLFITGKFYKDLKRGVMQGKAVPLEYKYEPPEMKEALKTMEHPPDGFNYYRFEYNPYYMQEFIKIISIDKTGALRLYIKKFITFFIDSGFAKSSAKTLKGLHLPPQLFYPYLYWGGRVLWILIGSVIVAGLFAFRRTWKKNIWLFLFLFMTVFYFAALTAIVNYGEAPRYRLPANPLIYLLFSYVVILFVKRLKINLCSKKH